MKKEKLKSFCISMCMLGLFVVFTVLTKLVDVQQIGPKGSNVGFATVNGFVHNIIGVNMSLYNVTDWLGLVPIAFAFGFAVLGLVQWIKRKKLKNVDYNLFVLGGFYIVVIAVYVLFEIIPINYRPVLIDGFLEVSYPSSTTMLTMCIMPTSLMQLNSRIKNKTFKRIVEILIIAFTIFMVIGRLICGVHWITDIIGGVLISFFLITTYSFLTKLK